MDDFLLEGFVLEEDLRFEDLGDRIITITGTIRCLGGIVVEVEKALTVLDGEGPSATVQTFLYRYHAWIANQRNILRYENTDEHRNFIDHVHRYDTLGDGREVSVEEILEEKNIPTLADVLSELRDWYYANDEVIAKLTLP
jgi:hypothetical protein